ncbi:MAG: amino acid adenylation domain-containing protein, partial [Acidobacteriota bacterium]|nr:amino acid adenylation domain-containing protein [Acidobacteriota bacterium]
WRGDGELEFLGRFDHQVKVRGFRIELGEVESALLSHESVRDAVVAAWGVGSSQRLVAYVETGREEPEGDEGHDPRLVQALKTQLRDRLPDYMVPSEILEMASLPRTPNGKVDRKALPEPAGVRPEQAGRYVAPRNQTEALVSEIWAQVLELDRVGVTDSFFDLGGHSLLATQVMSRLRSSLGAEVPLRALFEAPTVAELAREVDMARRGEGAEIPPLERAPRDGDLMLSFAQQRLWFIDQLEPDSDSYNMPLPMRVRGALDPALVEQALTRVVARHEVLRTRFEERDGQPVQVIEEARPWRLPVADLSGLDETAAEAEGLRLAGALGAMTFDLSRGPLMRSCLVRLEPEHSLVLITMHHIISDGWSLGVLMDEVAEIYQAGVEGTEEADLPELPIQYADYALWQRGWLQGEVLEAEMAFWRGLLGESPPVLQLPTDRSRAVEGDGLAAERSKALSRELSDALRGFSRQRRTTLFITLLAATQTLLARWSGQPRLTVGTPVAGRNWMETEPLIGFFVNTLVLPADLATPTTFSEFLERVRDVSLDAQAHQEVPFEKLVEELEPERHLEHSPLFQVMFTVENADRPSGPEVEGLILEPLGGDAGSAKFELTVQVVDDPEQIELGVEYVSDLWDGTTMARFLDHLETLLQAVMEAPDSHPWELPLMQPAERHQLVREWGQARYGYPAGANIPELFAHQVQRTPDAPAVVAAADGETWSYADLARQSGEWASRLRALGVGRGDAVALCAERSPQMVAALLAILETGGYYVPLAADYPADRLRFMIEDTAARVLLTESALVEELPTEGLSLLLLDDPAVGGEAMGDGGATTGGDAEIDAADLAYVAYTSGSTGRPKGVAVPHRAVARLVRGANYADLGPEQVFLQLAPVSFDAATLEIWGPLLNGGRLVLMPPERPTPERITEVVEQHGVTTLWLTAGLFHLMVDECLEGLRPLRQLLAGGDVLSPERVLAVLGLEDGPRVINGYGPTENTTFTSCWPMERPDQVGETVSIGRPVSNTTVAVLDRRLQPAPVGVFGELWAGGDGLSRGYLGRPGLTAERFLPDATGETGAGGRLYRTGDLVRWRGEGVLEFLGRSDFQVKVRGFRIELGEIEAALLALPEVRQSVVVSRQRSAGGKHLVGYVVPTEDQDGETPKLSSPALREQLAATLPDYMVPSALVVLEALPLDPNGKVDRKALPEPAEGRAGDAGEFLAPRNQTEAMVAEIWAEVLEVPQVGARDDFFELGGHSLLATQVMSRLRSSMGAEVPLRELFEGPTVERLAQAVDRARRADAGLAPPPLTPVPRDTALPLSFAQQRLWFIDQLDPGSAAYNMPLPLHAEGELDIAAMERALTAVVTRHESLRTRFVSEAGQPRQEVRPASFFAVPVIDLQGLPEDQRETVLMDLAAVEGMRPFDLEHDLMLRGAAVRMSPQHHAALFSMHHIASDGWSMGLLVDEVSLFYQHQVTGDETLLEDLPELPVQYADFAAWQRDWLSGEVLEQELDYWRERLEGAPPLLELPLDRPRPEEPTMLGSSISVELPVALSERLRGLGRRHQVTPFMVLLAGFQTVLGRWAGQDDVSVGTPLAGRNHLEVENLIGFFVNTLVLRTRFEGLPTFVDVLAQVREQSLEAHMHQELPFERLVEELQPDRSLNHSPLFQVMFALQNAPGGELQLEGLQLSPLDFDESVAKFDLNLAMEEHESAFEGTLEYVTELFDRTTMERFLGHFENLLAAALDSPETPVRDLSLLSPAERHQVTREWNEARRPYPREATVPDLFAQQAGETPDAIALVLAGDGTTVTYGELAVLASGLAERLRAAGVSRGEAVALAAERSPRMVAALLAILQVGGFYVPLAPEYPAERLRFMVEDAGVRVLLADRAMAEELPVEGLDVLWLDGEDGAEESAAGAPGALETGLDAQDLAYVAYTSGSTGKPKGVAVAHRAVVRLVSDANYTELGPERSVLHLSPVSFDAATFEIWGPLLTGGRVVLLAPERPTPENVGRAIAEHGVTTLFITAGLFHLVVDEQPEALQPLDHVLSGGEVLSPERVRRVIELPDGPVMSNVYGPTENTTFSTGFPMTSPEQVGTSVSIGRTVSNSSLWIVDRQLRPVPVGVAGELVLGGDGLARGYLGQPGLTAERFVPSPWPSDAVGQRLYRTGDLVRWRSDGNLEFIGRTDFQVKVRGFRIELGEVEAALLDQPQVRRAVVVAMADPHGSSKRLVAYVVPPEGSEKDGTQWPEAGGLRRALADDLPDYMVPSAFVVLEELPLNANGKVDRKALPDPDWSASTAVAPYRAPQTPTEGMVADLWADVLSLPRVGRDDDFFDLGGHSLLATQLMARLRDALGVEVPLRALFEGPSVAELARVVDETKVGESGLQAPPLEPMERPADGDGLPLSFAQQRLWFIDQLEPGSPVYNMPIPVQLVGPLTVAKLSQAVAGVIRRHEALRTTFSAAGEQPVQRIHPPEPSALPVADLTGLAPAVARAEAARLVGEDALRPFDLEHGPVLRISLLRLGDEEHVVVANMHHIVSDGWSLNLLTSEVGEFYESMNAGEEPDLDPLPIQYADYAHWQREWLSGDVLATEVDFWRDALSGAPPVLELPTDRPRPPARGITGGVYQIPFDGDLAEALRVRSRASGVTTFMTLLAGFQALLARYSGQDDISVGSPVAGRTHTEIEALIGFFVNTLVLRSDLSDSPDLTTLLHRVRDISLEAYAHQSVPFEKLVEELQPERSMAYSPLFQVMFVYQNTPREPVELTELRLEPFDPVGEGEDEKNVGETMAKFDLTLGVEEVGDDLSGSLEFSRDLFDETTAGRMVEHFQLLLRRWIEEPERSFREIELLSAAERQQLVEWNDTGRPRPAAQSLHQAFSA